MLDISETIRLTVKAIPAVKPHLNGRALAFVWNINPDVKTQEYFEATVEHLILQVYNGNMGGEFIDIMANLIQGQLTDAYNQAWEDDGNTLPLPDYLESAVQGAIVDQFDFVDQLYRDIVDARVDGTGSPTARAALWANRWSESYNDAVRLINVETGGKLTWTLGATEKHCPTCEGLSGIVAYASEWDQLGVLTQNAPNDKLACGGWRCDCSLDPTDQRRSPNAFGSIMNIIGSTVGG